jgi:hypothetical protein
LNYLFIYPADTWKPIVRSKFIPIDVENSYLYLKLNGKSGGSDKGTRMYFSDITGRRAGGIDIQYDVPVRFNLQYCQKTFTTSTASLPANSDNVWTLEKRGLQIIVSLDGKPVYKAAASNETCDNPRRSKTWLNYWNRTVSYVEFSSRHDTASQFYHIGL